MIWTNRATVYDDKNPVPCQHQRRLEDKGKSESNTLFYWILAAPVIPAEGGDDWSFDPDGVRRWMMPP